MPKEKSKAIIEEPPTDIKGSGIPVTGSKPRFMPILIKVWAQISKAIPNVNKNKGKLLVVW
jgi:hypothetical protein